MGWGISDFIGGLKSRQLPILTVLLFSNIFGLAVISTIVCFRGQGLPNNPILSWAVFGGMIAMISMFLLYRGLAIGPMSIVAPISAMGVILPVIRGIWLGEFLTGFQIFGIFLAILGVVLAARKKDPNTKAKIASGGVGFAIAAAMVIGIFFIVMDKASEVDPYWAALLMKMSYSIFLIPILLIARPSLNIARSHFCGVMAAGTIDSLATFAFTLATSLGMLSLVSVVSSLYPAVTVVLSAFLLKERPRNVQIAGIIFALIGIVFISF